MESLTIKRTLSITFILFTFLFSQFTEVSVKVDKRQVRENERYIFDSLDNDINQYLVNNVFTETSDELDMFLDLHLIIDSFSS